MAPLFPQPVHGINLEDTSKKTDLGLKNYFHANHEYYGIRIHENLGHHNHTPHLLGSAFLLGADEIQLKELFASSCSVTDKWTQPPGKITNENFEKHLGDATYQKAYVDYFTDNVESNDWKEVAYKFLYGGPKPLCNALMCGLTHPMIHLAYAAEFQSRELTIEALGLLATCYDFMPKYFEKEYTTGNETPMAIISMIRNDPRFDNASVKTIHTMEPLFNVAENAFLEYWNMWTPSAEQLNLAQRLVVVMLCGPDQNDFALCHALTSYHAIRVLTPPMHEHGIELARQWWLWVVGAYVMQGRPLLSEDKIGPVNEDWSWVIQQTLTGKWKTDHHFVKAVRAVKDAAETWGDEDSFYLNAAVRFVKKFAYWTGFGEELPSFERHVASTTGSR